MGTASEAPPPPDTSRYSDAAFAEGQRMSDWARQMWQSGQEEWGRLQQWSQQVMGSALPAMEDMYGWAAEQRERYEQYAVPAIQSLFSEAERYASKEEEMRQRATAVQDVKSATEAQREAEIRKLESYGIDPSETRYQALDKQAGVGEAAIAALAANTAGERTKAIGRDLRAQAIGVGQDMARQSIAGTGQGTATGTAGLGAGTGAAVGGAQVGSAALPFAGGALQGYSTGAGIVDQNYARALQQTAINNAAGQQNFGNMLSIGEGLGMALPYIPGVGEWMTSRQNAISGAAEGGPVSAPGGPTSDGGALALSDGEYVIPADVVRKMGTNHFDKLIEKETGRPPPATKQAIPIDAKNKKVMGMAPQGSAPAGVLA